MVADLRASLQALGVDVSGVTREKQARLAVRPVRRYIGVNISASLQSGSLPAPLFFITRRDR